MFTKTFWGRTLILWLASLLLVSCFPLPAQDETAVADGLHELTIHVISFNQIPFTRASGAQSVTHLDLAIFDETDTRIVKLNQLSTDADFLNPTVLVPEGELKLVLIAHGGEGVATLTSPTEATFPKNKVTDTFSAYRTLTITEDSSTDITLDLPRVVSMVRVILADAELPSTFSQLQLYYTGGSSTFNPQTGYGAKNSRQTEIRTLAESTLDSEGHRQFEIYTFPHILDDELKLTLTPQDATGQAIASARVIDQIPVRVNSITECQGILFTSGTNTNGSIHITINDQWGETLHHDF